MKAVSVFMDVEDPINPLADDAALDFAHLFSEVKVRGSFCLTGEKCRTLHARGRTDIAEAFKPHSLGLHTNGHSFHPTTMELLAELPFDDGCKAAYDEESKGFDAFQNLFGRKPTFWGGGGNTWSPEVTYALDRLGIPAYVYAMTELPNQAVHQFNGILALPQALSISEADWADDTRASEGGHRVLTQIQAIDQPWLGIFVGHPTKFRHKDYWDIPYYNGRTPTSPELVEVTPDDTYERAKSNLRSFLYALSRNVEIVGVDDATQFPWTFRPPTQDERTYFVEHTSANLRSATGWPPHRKGLSAELIVEKTMDLANTLRVATLP